MLYLACCTKKKKGRRKRKGVYVYLDLVRDKREREGGGGGIGMRSDCMFETEDRENLILNKTQIFFCSIIYLHVLQRSAVNQRWNTITQKENKETELIMLWKKNRQLANSQIWTYALWNNTDVKNVKNSHVTMTINRERKRERERERERDTHTDWHKQFSFTFQICKALDVPDTNTTMAPVAHAASAAKSTKRGGSTLQPTRTTEIRLQMTSGVSVRPATQGEERGEQSELRLKRRRIIPLLRKSQKACVWHVFFAANASPDVESSGDPTTLNTYNLAHGKTLTKPTWHQQSCARPASTRHATTFQHKTWHQTAVWTELWNNFATMQHAYPSHRQERT